MKYIAFLALLLVIFALGCVGEQKIVKAGDNVSVDYLGYLENGTLFDTSEGRETLNFTAGDGNMIKGFDDAVIGMKAGEEKTITIQPEEAYGAYDITAFRIVPLENIRAAGIEPYVNQTLYLGFTQVKVLEITYNNQAQFNITNTNSTLNVSAGSVRIDINHPLAGKVLVFKIKMLGVNA